MGGQTCWGLGDRLNFDWNYKGETSYYILSFEEYLIPTLNKFHPLYLIVEGEMFQ